MWTPIFRCPMCRMPLALNEDGADCASCGRAYSRTDWLFRFVAPQIMRRIQPFVDQYRVVRSADGHGPRSVAAYRALPDALPGDPLVREWRLRRQSYDTLCRAFRLHAEVGLRVLDLGAGNGWLSNRLARAGHQPVAVDVNDDACDGLRTCHLYEDRFPLVQAHADYLPFKAGQFDLVVFNASLHYAADPVRTLLGASHMLADGGSLVVMDSPLFTRPEDGESMVTRQLEQLRLRFALTSPIRPGLGFITFDMLADAADAMGRTAVFVASRLSVRAHLARVIARYQLGRVPAAFGLWATQ